MKKTTIVAIEDGAKGKKKSTKSPKEKQAAVEKIGTDNPEVEPIHASTDTGSATEKKQTNTLDKSEKTSSFSSLEIRTQIPLKRTQGHRPLTAKTGIERVKEYNPEPVKDLKPLNIKTGTYWVEEYLRDFAPIEMKEWSESSKNVESYVSEDGFSDYDSDLRMKYADYTYEQLENELHQEIIKNTKAIGEEFDAGQKRISLLKELMQERAIQSENQLTMKKELNRLYEAYIAAQDIYLADIQTKEQEYLDACELYNYYYSYQLECEAIGVENPYRTELREALLNRDRAKRALDEAKQSLNDARWAYEDYQIRYYNSSRESDADRARNVYVGEKTLWDIVFYDEQIRNILLSEEPGRIIPNGQQLYQQIVDAARIEAAANNLDYDKLLEYANRRHDREEAAQKRQEVQEFVQKNALNAGVANVGSVITRMTSGVGMISEVLQGFLNASKAPEDRIPINYYDVWHKPTHYTNTVRDTTAEEIQASYDNAVGTGLAGAYRIGMGIVDVAATILVSRAAAAYLGASSLASPIAATVLNSADFAENFVRMKEAGVSDSVALNRCVGNFIIDVIGENISLGNILKAKPGGGWKAVLKAAGIEGTQEVAVETAKIALDYAMNQERSEWGEAYNMYLLSGLSEGEAEWCVIRDTLHQIGFAGIQGLVSGGAAEITYIMSKAQHVEQLENTQTGIKLVQDGKLQQLFDAALSLPVFTQARNLADRLMEEAVELFYQENRWMQSGMDGLERSIGGLLEEWLGPALQMQPAMAADYVGVGYNETWGEGASADFGESKGITVADVGRLHNILVNELTDEKAAGILTPQAKSYLVLKNNRNGSLRGTVHPVTKVPFVEKMIEINGDNYSVVVPEFEVLAAETLDEPLLMARREKQKRECTKRLGERLKADPALRGGFSSEQVHCFMKGICPRDLTWHHDAEVGRMVLVNKMIHMKTAHIGGYYIWGRGKKGVD